MVNCKGDLCMGKRGSGRRFHSRISRWEYGEKKVWVSEHCFIMVRVPVKVVYEDGTEKELDW